MLHAIFWKGKESKGNSVFEWLKEGSVLDEIGEKNREENISNVFIYLWYKISIMKLLYKIIAH